MRVVNTGETLVDCCEVNDIDAHPSSMLPQPHLSTTITQLQSSCFGSSSTNWAMALAPNNNSARDRAPQHRLEEHGLLLLGNINIGPPPKLVQRPTRGMHTTSGRLCRSKERGLDKKKRKRMTCKRLGVRVFWGCTVTSARQGRLQGENKCEYFSEDGVARDLKNNSKNHTNK
jgi:hypothetical protein